MNIYNVIILDESGSMSSIYRETITSMNEVLSGIRRNQEEFEEQRHFVTIVTFEGSGIAGVKTRRDRVPVDTVEPFSEQDYRPGGCTPLYDAMGKTLNEMEGLIHEDEKVMVTVITDGMENSSEEYSGRIIKNLVNRLRGNGWGFAYIGANQDAIEVARDLDIRNALNYDATPCGMRRMSKHSMKAFNKIAQDIHFCMDLGEVDNLFDTDEDNSSEN